MAQFLDAPVPPDALTTFVREVPKPRNNRLTELFGTPKILDSNTVDFLEIVKTNRTAKYRSYDGRIHVSSRDTGSEKRVPLAPLSSSSPAIGEYERLQQEFARTQGTNKAVLERAIYNDGENLTNEIYNRIELAWGDVLTDGILNIDENGFINEADYGLPANHSVAPATPWTNLTAATPLTDLQAWCDVYNATNGFLPGSFLPSLKQMRLLQRNKEIIDAVFGATQGRTHVTTADLINLFSSEGLPTPLAPYDNVLDVDGVSTRVMAEDRLTILPPNLEDLGFTAFGLTATALEMADSGEIDRVETDPQGIVAKVVKVDGPPTRRFTWVDACGQPILSNARRLMTVDAF